MESLLECFRCKVLHIAAEEAVVYNLTRPRLGFAREKGRGTHGYHVPT